MAKIITMPTTPNFSKSNFRLRRTIGVASSPYTGSVRTQEYDGVYWEAEVSLPPMRREIALEWQSFLLNLNGSINTFKFSDPDALNPRGTMTGEFRGDQRVNETSATLSFTAATNTIAGASNTTYFNSVLVGDYIMITGSANVDNNGTHKVLTKPNAYTITVSPQKADILVDESNKAGCKIRVNVKGCTGLTLKADSNSATGTLLKGDYLAISNSTTKSESGYTPVQYVMVTEDATLNVNAGADTYGVQIQPKLRASLTGATNYVYHSPAKGLFRLTNNAAEWSADNISNYGISFSCIEVV